jgi:LmbE family N-acetylglucosaminyl deacetylase
MAGGRTLQHERPPPPIDLGAPEGTPRRALLVRWTVGDVSREGFDALRLSTWGGRRVFGAEARYVVCVNTIPVSRARALTGPVPPGIAWLDVSDRLCPVIAEYTDEGMAEGVGWKYAPSRVDPEAYELHLDNDCILWAMPDAVRRWLEDPEPRCLLAEDVATMLGRFATLCGPAPRNTGIRGVPPGFDLSEAFRTVLEETGVTLRSELDEQGLVTLVCSRQRPPHVVRVDEVAICGPFPPHRQQIGTCGAHFVGLNAKRLPWRHQGRWGESWVRENWERLRPQLLAAVRSRRAPASGTAEAALCAWCAARRERPGASATLVIVAHPDDEVIGAGARLAQVRPLEIAHVTDGAPRDGRAAAAVRFANPGEYRMARRAELRSAMALAGIGPDCLLDLGLVDQEAAHELRELTLRVVALFRRRRPAAVVTQPYEGGHPDHDAAAFAVHHACALLARRGIPPPAIIEMTSYHQHAGAFRQGRFAGGVEGVTVTLGPEERALKRRMLDCFATQRVTLAPFETEVERFRLAPGYDFLQPPDADGRYYERFPWGMTAAKWETLVRRARRSLGFADPASR